MNRFLVSFWALLSFGAVLWAQEAAPIVKAPSAGFVWTIKVEDANTSRKQPPAEPQGGKTPPSFPVRLTLKSGMNGVTLGEISFSDGRRETYYVAKGCLLVVSGNTNKGFCLPLETSEMDPFSLLVSGFPGIAWIAPSHYKGAEKIRGTACRHFAMVDKQPAGTITLDAWIRSEDGYPCEAKVDDRVYRLESVDPYPGNILIPEVFQAGLAQRQKELSGLDAIRQANRQQAQTTR